jgi:hypothetical protein
VLKTCTKCKQQKELTEFTFRVNRGKHEAACKVCENLRKSKSSPFLAPKVPLIVPFKAEQSSDLPEPELLPAPYAKRVYEMWKSLVGEAPQSGVRIA